VPAGALQATAAVRYVDQAELRALCHAFRALFAAELNVVHAALIAVLTALKSAPVYACLSAAARALYAAFSAPVYVVIAPSKDASRVFTAAPTHAIFVAAFGCVPVVGGVVVCASAGSAESIAPATIAPLRICFVVIPLN
jgi:hypothetical protein